MNFKISKNLLTGIFMLNFLSLANVPYLSNNIYAESNKITVSEYKKGTVQTTSYGIVQGAEIYDSKTLLWKGIPYAKAPVGDLRWKSPKNPDAWEGIYDATKNGNLGIQLSGNNIIGKEDCLNLDIYRPNTNEKNLPVMVYIHGGNNQGGTSQEINPQKFVVNANVITVSINYRLGILGFNNLPSLKSGDKYEDSGNYTLLDIAKSLDWVKENISSFGGDNDNIAIAGFSAGGRDVMAMLISPIFKDKFQKAISFSGGMTIANEEYSQKIFAKSIAPLVVEDKVKNSEEEAYKWLLSTDKNVKKYLYSLSAERLAGLMTNASIRMAVFPHLLNDGTVIQKEGFSTKDFNNVPLIMATGSSEFSLFGRFDKTFVSTKDENLLDNSEIAKEFSYIYKYGNRFYALFNAQESAERMYENYKAPIYTCDFDWGTDTKVFNKKTSSLYGALHGIWIPFLMDDVQGASALIADSLDNKGAKDLSKKFTKYISNFLWNSDPNSKNLVKWLPWQDKNVGPTQLLLNADMNTSIITMSQERDNYNKILKDMENDKSISKEQKKKMIKEVLNGRWFSRGLDEHFKNESPWVQIF